MKLQTYLKLNGIGITEAAKQLGCTRQWIHEIISGRQPAGRKMAIKIVKWTDGEVRLEDLWRD
ncbi:MAG: helix-turn-helix domain-containing protein [Deltaproteobacteria bacterium]|nr:helix-turn-helix domain-containing protein [Deltaproteobacteria bacterium]